MKTHLPICMKKVHYEFTVAGKKKERRAWKRSKRRDLSLTRGPQETDLSSKGIHYGKMIALSGIIQRRRRSHTGRKQHDVNAFFLDGGCSPQKFSPKNSGSRGTLWFKECPKSHCCQRWRVCTNLAVRNLRKISLCLEAEVCWETFSIF